MLLKGHILSVLLITTFCCVRLLVVKIHGFLIIDPTTLFLDITHHRFKIMHGNVSPGRISTTACPDGDKATPSLKELVIGKCLEYQIRINPSAFCDGMKDCNDIWLKFKSGFAGQSLCNVSSAGYQEYVDATQHDTPRDQHIFWENVYDLVHRYSNKGARLTALEDTLTGYIVDTLRFCGDAGSPEGIAKDIVCPSYEATADCPLSAERAFWILASKQYAQNAVGHISVMLNASLDPIYRPDTYFAVYEAPYLQEEKVTNAKIILVNDDPTTKRDSCSDSSLKALFTLLENKGIHATCEENPRDVMFLHCADSLSSPVCSTIVLSKSSESLTGLTVLEMVAIALLSRISQHWV